MQHILTGLYIGARMRNENGVWHVWQDVETFARNTHALILKKGVKRKKVNDKTFKTKAEAEKYFNQLLEG